MPDLTTTTHDGAGQVVLSVRGEIDLASAEEVRADLQRALQETGRRLVVDLRDVSFLDSTGLALLLRLNRQAHESGRELVVVKGPPHVQRVFALTGASELLTMLDRIPVDGG